MPNRLFRVSCMLLLVAAGGACAGGPTGLSRATAAIPYDGPIFRGVTAYVQEGVPYDFSHGVGVEQAARAAHIALSSAEVSQDTEVGLIAPSPTTESGCGDACVQVTLVDYDAGVTHNVIVDVVAGKIVADVVQDTVVAALGEDGIRGLYGIALGDPEVKKVVGDAVAVSAEVSPFTSTKGPCSEEHQPPHRCAYGVIYFPGGDAYVYVDLTDQLVVEWFSDEDEAE